MLPAPFLPHKVKNEVAENVKWLSNVGKATNVVGLGLGGVIFSFKDGFAEQDERPGGGDIGRCPPFLPDVLERLPCLFGGSQGGNVAEIQRPRWCRPYMRGDPHALEPGSD